MALGSLTPDQRECQRAANQMAHHIIELAGRASSPTSAATLTSRCAYIPTSATPFGPLSGTQPGLAADPPAGATRIGRNSRGRVVVIVLHTAAWSLLRCPAGPHPAVWTFLDDLGHRPIRFHSGGDLLNAHWTDMANAVFPR
jgi:hypothetical protein